MKDWRRICALVVCICGADAMQAESLSLKSVPDGVSVFVSSNGEFEIRSLASASYETKDPLARRQAEQVATLKAKRGLTAFLSESIEAEEVIEVRSRHVMSVASDGTVTRMEKWGAKKVLFRIHERAHSFLKGYERRAPVHEAHEGGSGIVRVTLVLSSKTISEASASSD